ncbi:MAG: hypothetical protein EXS37_17135 [Opitutus sp.]|nr:hypothetical protein [Opitutus sp.]
MSRLKFACHFIPGLIFSVPEFAASARPHTSSRDPNRTQIVTDIASIETTMSNANEGWVLNNPPDHTESEFAMNSEPAGRSWRRLHQSPADRCIDR